MDYGMKTHLLHVQAHIQETLTALCTDHFIILVKLKMCAVILVED